jgi:hypothetical protein
VAARSPVRRRFLVALLPVVVVACAGAPEEVPVSTDWALDAWEGSSARLDTLTGGVLNLTDLVSPYLISWHIQLRKRGVAVDAGLEYVLRFRARSNLPRRVEYSLLLDREPYTSLGVYGNAELVPVWRTFEAPFIATLTEPRGEILFNLGRDTAGLRIAEVMLIRVADGAIVVAADPPATP